MVLHQGLAGVGLGLGQLELGVQKIGDRTGVDRIHGELLFECVPGVLFELLVAEAQAAVVFVDFQDNDFDVGTDLREF